MVQRCISRPRVRVAALLAVLLAAGLVSSATGPGAGAAKRSQGAAPSTYTNPLRPRIPGDGVVESCADPTVVRGQGEDPYWYMYCTTDPQRRRPRRRGWPGVPPD